MSNSFVWEQHCCLPLTTDAHIGDLARYTNPGGTFVSVNVGYAPHGADDVRLLLRSWTAQLRSDERFVRVGTAEDIQLAKNEGAIAVVFDLEDSNPLEGDLDLVQEFYDAGVRTMVPTYNNAIGPAEAASTSSMRG